MRTYLIKTPNLFRWIYPKLIWSFSTSKKELYLTFDDGPTPEITDWVLETLKKYHAKATFFCIGKNITNHPEIFQKIIEEGHAVGNHTNNHLNGWQTPVEDYLNNISIAKKTNQQFNKSTIQQLFRPPYGKIKKKQAQQLIQKGYKIIMWDVLSADFDQSISEEKCYQNVLKNTEKGSVIVFHDSLKAAKNMKYALPKVLDYFSKRGFEFKTIESQSILNQ
ncbi:MAG: polysaccharide deacetylase family protein [Flavobacteriaceae bacterium]|nr:polysaccharide deacetylase family protein [Flavobacteriaceae bacterium]